MSEGQRERSQSWCNPSARQEAGGEPEGEEEQTEDEKKQQEEEEDPYTFAEIDDSEYDMILANTSTKKKIGGRSFIINRPPAPTPRPTNIPPKEETTPYIAQGNVFRCCLCVCDWGRNCPHFWWDLNPKDEKYLFMS